MKQFTNFIKRIKQSEKGSFLLDTAVFYLLFMTVALYLLSTNLSAVPAFIYSQF